MALYTRKKGAFVKLTKEQIRRLRRYEQVLQLQVEARKASMQLRIFAAWLEGVDHKSKVLNSEELKLTKLPSRTRFVNQADNIDHALRVLRQA